MFGHKIRGTNKSNFFYSNIKIVIILYPFAPSVIMSFKLVPVNYSIVR